MTAKTRTVLWAKEGPLGLEVAEVTLTSSTLAAVGVAIGSAPVPYRLDYRLKTRPGFVTARLRATTRGDGWCRQLDLRRAASGTWSATTQEAGDTSLPPSGGDVALLADALDGDLGASPLTNSLPVLRCALLRGGGPVTCSMAWISVPALRVQLDGQRSTCLRTEPNQSVIRYEAVDGSFTADITFDRDGVVLDYPGIARRLPEAIPLRTPPCSTRAEISSVQISPHWLPDLSLAAEAWLVSMRRYPSTCFTQDARSAPRCCQSWGLPPQRSHAGEEVTPRTAGGAMRAMRDVTTPVGVVYWCGPSDVPSGGRAVARRTFGYRFGYTGTTAPRRQGQGAVPYLGSVVPGGGFEPPTKGL